MGPFTLILESGTANFGKVQKLVDTDKVAVVTGENTVVMRAVKGITNALDCDRTRKKPLCAHQGAACLMTFPNGFDPSEQESNTRSYPSDLVHSAKDPNTYHNMIPERYCMGPDHAHIQNRIAAYPRVLFYRRTVAEI